MAVFSATTSLEALLKRDRVIAIAALILTTAVAWAYMMHEARSMMHTGVCECMGLVMAGPDTREWSVPQLLALFLMWSEMMVAMMLPSAAPMILTFTSVNRSRREQQQRARTPSGAFVSGYLIAWAGFSLAATALQLTLHKAALLSPLMTMTSPRLSGTLLITAGLFQFTPWKSACLSRCANPLTLLLTGWREGTGGAIRMGLQHGFFCVGCCWALMLLLFVVGVMNVGWIAALTLYVLIEKLLGRNIWFGRITGAALCAWGLWSITDGT